jgi:glutathione S-transferase
MIEVYSWATPNGHKVHVMLEECGLEYRAIPVNIGAGEQFAPEFLAISPNNKIPAIVDPDGPDGKPISLFESGAILLYLAAKTGRFLPDDIRARYRVLEWLMFQMGSVGPMLGQTHHFRPLRSRKAPVRDRALQQRGQAHLRRPRQAARRPRLGRERRLLDRRHRDLPVAAVVAEPGHRLGRLPAPEALVRPRRGAPGGAARRRGAGEPEEAVSHRRRARGAVRREAVRAALISAAVPAA